MVKAVRIHEYGGPEKLRYEDIDMGEPGPGRALIRHTAIGLNFADTHNYLVTAKNIEGPWSEPTFLNSSANGLTFLATVGSVAPFVGLFGTVWGIKHAFEQIAMQQSTNLAVVAPGIAEALLATGLGLLAAIPAVIFYNKLNRDAEEIIGGWEAFSDEFSLILSRQLEQGAA